MMAQTSRRDFVKGAGAIAGLAAAATIPRAVMAAEAQPTWDKEAEIVVVGSGTVAVAAIAAADLGAESVLVLEKDEELFGGTSRMSGGGYALTALIDDAEREGIVDNVEDTLTYIKACGEDRMDEGVIEAFVANLRGNPAEPRPIG